MVMCMSTTESMMELRDPSAFRTGVLSPVVHVLMPFLSTKLLLILVFVHPLSISALALAVLHMSTVVRVADMSICGLPDALIHGNESSHCTGGHTLLSITACSTFFLTRGCVASSSGQ
jgi:hypothetical protein